MWIFADYGVILLEMYVYDRFKTVKKEWKIWV